MRPYGNVVPKRLLYAPDYFKKLTTTPCGINLYGTFHIFGNKGKITRAFKSLPLLTQHKRLQLTKLQNTDRLLQGRKPDILARIHKPNHGHVVE